MTTREQTVDQQHQGFVGSWRATIFETDGPPTQALFTLGADGTLVSAEHPIVTPPGAGRIFTSSGHGAWMADGPGTAIITFVGLGSREEGTLFGTVTIRAAVALDAGGHTCRGQFVATLADPDEHPLATFTGTLEATRIVAEAPVMSASVA